MRMLTAALIVTIVSFAGSIDRTDAQETPGKENAGQEVDFNRDVRPILSDACFTCHGPDSGHREADLRLDQQDGLFLSLDGTTVVDPASPQNSELLKRIMSHDADVIMPPPGSVRKLTDVEKATIERWIQQGAKWKGHWAYIIAEKPTVPQSESDAAANVIDRFVSKGLSTRQLAPLGSADPATLVRRLCFDLTGLPPTPQQVASFTAAPTQENWQLLIEELLASQRYAERMTAFWLDLVRYADTNGIHGDNHREVWMYRDWVIDAFHRNMPFDQFTVEQLAGDLLPDATDSQKIASGYNRLLMTTREGGAQAKEYLAKYSADRVRNASTVWLGASMGCCECHDHKFDPYSIQDFYQFAAFFADIQDVPVGVQPSVKMPSPEQKQQLSELDGKLAELQKRLDTQTPELDAALETWASELHERSQKMQGAWHVPKVVDMKSSGSQTMKLQKNGAVITSGDNPKHDTYRLSIAPPAGPVTAIRLETLANNKFARKSLSRPPGNGNFVLSQVNVFHVVDADKTQHAVAIKDAVASYEQPSWPVANALDGKPDTGWAVDGHNDPLKQPVAAFRFVEAVNLAEGDRLIVELQQTSVDFHNIGQFRLATTQLDSPELNDTSLGVPAELLASISAWPNLPDGDREKLAAHFRTVTPALEDVRQQHASTTKARAKLDGQIPETLITRTQPPREIRVLARGDWMDDSGTLVEPAVPHFMTQLATKQRASRLELANWLVADTNPVVARVFVNRLWQMMFGRGIVKSADDFGSQGSWPTHPELLDWLSVEFRESGWNVQHIIKLIASSDTYRRSSVATPELMEADPFNNWLARQSRFRLDAEFIRDNALAVSGLLVEKVGGKSVKPYQPAGYWDHLNFPKRTWQADSGDDQYRRGLYTYWCRTFLHPAMRSFDAPSREECAVDRPRSNNSLQALVLLNDPSFVEAARNLATLALQSGGETADQRIEFLYQRCLSRAPRENEVAVLKQLLADQAKQFQAAPEQMDQFLSVGQSVPTSEFDKTDVAAWTAVSRVILNLHEVITRS